jgi:integrase
MRIGDIDRSADVWAYRPAGHKTLHHGHGRIIFIGKKGQAVLSPFLLKLDPAAYVFSAADSVNEMRQRRSEGRKTPATYGNVAGSNRKRKPSRMPGDRFDVRVYARAIARAADAADRWAHGGMTIADNERIIEHWHPHRLRHSSATDIRRQFGIEAAQHVLGHATLSITELYAEKNGDVAKRVALAIG